MELSPALFPKLEDLQGIGAFKYISHKLPESLKVRTVHCPPCFLFFFFKQLHRTNLYTMYYLRFVLPGALGLVPAVTAVTNIWLAGDSTMAAGGGGTGTEGWGQYLQYSFDSSEYVVNNEAIAGRSARSYWREGRFQDIADELSAGDVSLNGCWE